MALKNIPRIHNIQGAFSKLPQTIEVRLDKDLTLETYVISPSPLNISLKALSAVVRYKGKILLIYTHEGVEIFASRGSSKDRQARINRANALLQGFVHIRQVDGNLCITTKVASLEWTGRQIALVREDGSVKLFG